MKIVQKTGYLFDRRQLYRRTRHIVGVSVGTSWRWRKIEIAVGGNDQARKTRAKERKVKWQQEIRKKFIVIVWSTKNLRSTGRQCYAAALCRYIGITDSSRHTDGQSRWSTLISFVGKLTQPEGAVSVTERNLDVDSLYCSRRRRKRVFQRDYGVGDCVNETQLIKRCLACRAVVARCGPTNIKAPSSLRIDMETSDGSRWCVVVFRERTETVRDIQTTSSNRLIGQRSRNVSIKQQQVLYLLDGKIWILRPEQSGGSGNVRSGHRSAAKNRIGVSRRRAKNSAARRT